jgi:hypothetical protein
MAKPRDPRIPREPSASDLTGAYGFRRLRGRRTQVVELPAEDQLGEGTEGEAGQDAEAVSDAGPRLRADAGAPRRSARPGDEDQRQVPVP